MHAPLDCTGADVGAVAGGSGASGGGISVLASRTDDGTTPVGHQMPADGACPVLYPSLPDMLSPAPGVLSPKPCAPHGAMAVPAEQLLPLRGIPSMLGGRPPVTTAREPM